MVGIRPGPQRSYASPIARPNPAQGAAQDIEEITGASVEGSYNDPIPAVDFRWTWQTKKQAGFEYTRNSLSAGFDRQRGRFEDVAANIASSSLLTHHSNDVNLPFLSESANLDYKATGLTFQNPIVSTVFQGRAIWGIYSSSAIFAETSTNDSTPVQILSTYTGYLYSLKTALIDGVECLIVTLGQTVYAFRDLNPVTLHASFSGVSANTTPGVIGWIQQMPLPKRPILVRNGREYYLIRSDWGTEPPTLNSATQTNQVAGVATALIGLGSVGGRPPYVYTLEQGGYIAYTDVYGMRYSLFQGIDLPRITQAALVRGGMIALGDQGKRIIFYDGKPYDTRIFKDPEPVSGFFYTVNGFHVVEDAIFADVNLASTSVLGASVTFAGLANTTRQTWRLDLDRMRWSPVSEWTTWINQSIAPTVIQNPFATLGQTGNVALNGSAGTIESSLPYGPITRTLHHIPGQLGNLTYRRFEPPPGTSPYSIRGTKSLAVDGTTQGPGMLFPKGPGFDATYLDKYIDGIYWGGQDTGGTGSYLRVRVAEHGRIENTNPSPLTAYFRKGVTHQGRYFPFNSDQAMLFPQEEYFINRGSDTTATLQALPVTFVGHVNIRETEGRRPWLSWGRSKG